MVLDQKQTTIAYRCPECGSVVRSIVGVFSLTADMIKLKCPCGGSSLDIVYTNDKKIRLTVPCFICPSPHSYLLSTSVFFDRDIFALSCTYSGIDICFIGKEDEVDKAIAENEAELHELIGETSSINELSSMRKRENLTDPQVLEIVSYVIKEFEEEGNIHCKCKDGGKYEVQIGDEYIFIVCKKCGAEIKIPAGSVSSAQAFLERDEIILS